MSSILIATVPIHGHVTPLLAVARHFVERGDRVRFLTGSRFAEAVRATGAEHLPLPAIADYDDRIDLNVRFPERAELSGPKSLAFDIIELFTRPSRAQHDAVMAAHAAEPADALLVDPAFTGASMVLGHARAARPAVVMCGVLPLSLASRDTAPFGLGIPPLAGPLGCARNAVLTGLAGRIFAPAQRVADEMHWELHGTAIPGPLLDWAARADAVVQFTVPEFEYPRSDAPGTLHFVGPISASGSVAPLPDWWDDLDGSRPVVHVTQGTIANKDFAQLVGPTLEALAGEDVLVVVATGGRPLDTLPPLPANARAAEFLPYDELLPKTAVYVTNAGYGGVQYALRYGVPIVASGGVEDKPEVGARIAWSGVGRRFTAVSPKPTALRTAVRAVLRDDRYRRAAHAMAERMSRSGGLPQLAAVVDGAGVRRTASKERR
ncbi:glycosyltransferase [Agromyces aurantiacus]|uniref:Glycosyltransferase n=1 Tax=Agromyces aurantiacus TaxID=165814 RepID=A0ABV9R557_9MICO|nr:nucleotide disphospho-sugar-binding domain-containing protein [Agromyces aurantiacus]MBM7503798.1 UDP:flavonoid glycosyltransferase YjiC (YdhE family) [Agromyces aurantiacus]